MSSHSFHFFSRTKKKLAIHLNANLRHFSFSHGLAVSSKLIIQMRLAARVAVEGGKGGSVRFGGDPGTSLSRAVLTPPLGQALPLSFLPPSCATDGWSSRNLAVFKCRGARNLTPEIRPPVDLPHPWGFYCSDHSRCESERLSPNIPSASSTAALILHKGDKACIYCRRERCLSRSLRGPPALLNFLYSATCRQICSLLWMRSELMFFLLNFLNVTNCGVMMSSQMFSGGPQSSVGSVGICAVAEAQKQDILS